MGEADTPDLPPGGVIPNAVLAEQAKARLASGGGGGGQRATPLLMQQALAAGRPQPPPLREEAASPTMGDGLSIPFRLPSGGLFNQGSAPGHDGMIVISPTRGEHEEILAGAIDKPDVQLGILRHITSQCFQLRGIPYNELLVLDWTAAMLHFLAVSAGADTVNLPAGKHSCGADNDFSRAFTELPRTVLRLAEGGEAPTAVIEPHARNEEDVLREMEGEEAGAAPEQVRLVSVEQVHEPFHSTPLPRTQEVVSWRHHRVNDLIKAEEFASRMGDANVNAGGKMFTFLMARQIVAINGKALSPLEAIGWVRKQATPILNALREQIRDAEFGYDIQPEFPCKGCGQKVKVKLTLTGDLFRAASRT